MKTQLLKKIAALFIILISAHTGSGQNFTWMKGSNVADQGGNYGTMGQGAATNRPGARETPAYWKDAAGNFWLFGGYGFDGFSNSFLLNDLWKYSPATNVWTWMKGDNVVNAPGTYGTPGVSNPANKPGARQGATTWTDASGDLWLFGGITPFGEMNDLWKYSITTNEWTWMKGSNVAVAPASYGTLGVSAASNVPGSRSFSTGWTDASGNLYLFGGAGNDASSVFGGLNDIWKYNMASNEWVWIKGSAQCDQNGVYGTLGVASATNQPGTRYFTNSWQDATGNLWIMGGLGLDAFSNTEDLLNDFWRYDISTNAWSWIGGSVLDSQAGVYGSLGIGAPSNIPGARFGSATWKDGAGNFYLFGGYGNDYVPMREVLNDFWSYSPATNQWTWLKGSNVVAQSGIYGVPMQPSPASIPGARSTAASWTDTYGRFWLFGGAGMDVAGDPGELNDLWGYSNCAVPPTVSVTSSSSLMCSGTTVSLTATGASTYSWATLSSGSVIAVSPATTTNYTVVGTDYFGCRDTVSFAQLVSQCTGLKQVTTSSPSFRLYPNPNQGTFTVVLPDVSTPVQLFMYNALGEMVAERDLISEQTELQVPLPKGVYYYSLVHDGLKIGAGKWIVE